MFYFKTVCTYRVFGFMSFNLFRFMLQFGRLCPIYCQAIISDTMIGLYFLIKIDRTWLKVFSKETH
jgi:hypothetical protein